MSEETSNWYEWDASVKKWTFQKTEDHIFSPNGWNKRIGDMTRDELIHVIALGYQDREDLAKALVEVCESEGAMGIDEYAHAKRIVARLTCEDE